MKNITISQSIEGKKVSAISMYATNNNIPLNELVLTGRKDILGLWISENEGAKFWLNNFTEMKNRGLKDILIACSDNLTGMSEAISAVYPETEHQLCIVHQIRNSLAYVSYKDRKKVAADLKLVYSSVTEDEALGALSDFDLKWGKQYPHIAKS